MPMKHRAVHNPRPKLRNPSPEKLDALLSIATKPTLPVSAGAIEARRLIAEAQLKYKQQQENAMNAVVAQNERVKAALSEWGDEDTTPVAEKIQAESVKQRHYFKATVGVSQAAFSYVKDNPYTTTAQAISALEQQGFKKTSLSSLYTQMVRQGQLSKDKDGRLTALIPEYRPLKASATLRNLGLLIKSAAARKNKPKAKPKAPTKAAYPERQAPTVNIDVRAIKEQNAVRAGIATLNASHAQAGQAAPATPVAAPTPKLLTAAQVLETLSIKEAHILYRELQTMFG